MMGASRKQQVALLLSLALVGLQAKTQGPPGASMPPPEVTVCRVETTTVPVAYEYVGITQASKTVELRARIQGFIQSRNFNDGAYVKEGDLLFSIDPRSFEADLEIAAAQVDQAESRLHLAEQEVKRMQSVRQPGAITQSDLDVRLSEQANANAALKLARAQLAKAKLEVSYTKVVAPFTGYVEKALKEEGSLVDSGQNSLLTIMQQVDPLYVSFQVSESDFLAWKHEEKEGRQVLVGNMSKPSVSIMLLDGTPFSNEGILDFENTHLDLKTGTVELRATFENGEKTLKPGQFVKVRVAGWERPDSLVTPRRSVSQSPQGAYVYIVTQENKVEMRIVKTGPWAGENWVILEGLKEGEQVIVEGLTKVHTGMTITVAQPADKTQRSDSVVSDTAEVTPQS